MNMQAQILTRMGDGERLWIPELELKEEIAEGTADAAERGGVAALSESEQEQLFDIMADPARIVSVLPGEEVIVSDDGCSMSFYSGLDGVGVGVPMSRMLAVLTYDLACCVDSTSIGQSD